MPPFQEPANPRFSSNGVLDIDLNVVQTEMTIQCGDVNYTGLTRTYNNQMPGPTLYVTAGDRLNITLHNQLPEDDPSCHEHKKNHPHCFNTTNLHTHGLHVSPESDPATSIASDNVHIEVKPGATQQYCIEIPRFHACGTYWYHAHKHGATALQLLNGLAGALIIGERPEERIVKDERPDLVWIVHEIVDDPVENIYDAVTPDGNVAFLVNGLCQPTLVVTAGQIQRWRFINATATHRGIVRLELRKVNAAGETDPNAGLPQSMYLIAVDGISFYGKKPQQHDGHDFGPGNRADFLIHLKDPGEYTVVAITSSVFPVETPHEQVLAYVQVNGPSAGDNLPSTLRIPDVRPHYLCPIQDHEVRDRPERPVVFSMIPEEFWATICPGIEKPDHEPHGPNGVYHAINCATFDNDRIDVTVALHTAETWKIDTQESHPFHVHVNPFQVVGEKIDASGPDVPENRMWRDTVVVPQQTPVSIRTRFLTYHGLFVSHCHILTHEDKGMMQNVKVVGNGVGPCQRSFTAKYSQGDPGIGIGGYDLASSADRVFAFDYKSSGKPDHLVLYRPGTGTIWILKKPRCVFTPIYAQGDPGIGIGGYDLASSADRAFAFDYNGKGNTDHLVLYRPGTGTIWILKQAGGVFTPVYAQGDPGSGIGGYDLASSADRAFAFDYNGKGSTDHLVLYRPGTGTIWILKRAGGVFTAVYAQGDPGTGIGGYDLASSADRAFAFDYDSSGKLDHLVLYRPGTGTIWILKNDGGAFTAVYAQGDPGAGIGGYDLASTADRAFAFDYDGSGKLDHLVLYRPGTGAIWILKNSGGAFTPVYAQGDPGSGVGGYDLASSADRVVAFDYDGSGKLDHLALYRPGTGTIWILGRT